MFKSRLLLTFLTLGLTLSLSPPLQAQDLTLFQEAQQALQAGKTPEAIVLLERLTRLERENAAAFNLLASAYLEQNSLELTWATLQQAHQIDKNAPLNHYLKARYHLASKSLGRAQTELKTVAYLLERQPESDLWIALATTQAELGASDQALLALRAAQKMALSSTQEIQTYLLSAKLSPAQAEVAIEKALQLMLSAPNLSLPGAEVQSLFSQFPEVWQRIEAQALQNLDTALASQDTLSLTRELLKLERMLQKTETVPALQTRLLSQLEIAQEKYPRQPLLRQFVVKQYLKGQRYPDLLAFYRYELISQTKNWDEATQAEAIKRIADLHLRTGFLDFAFANYEKALSINPQLVEARQRLGLLYLVANNQGEALKQWDFLLKNNPLDQKSRLYQALSLAYAGKKEAAERTLAQVPAEFEPRLRDQVLVVLNNAREAKPELLELLLPEAQILSSHAQVL